MKSTFKTYLCIFALCSAAFAQTAGTVVGRVTDASKSAAPQAKVELVNQETGITATSAVSAEGDYAFQRVMPGNYRLTVTAEGFKTFLRRDIPILVNQTARVDVQLEVGAVATSVEVDARAPMIQTDSTSVGGVVDGEQIGDALNGRTISMARSLAPGVQGAGSNRRSRARRIEAAQAQRSTACRTTTRSATPARTMPSLDSVAEFKVIANAAPAEIRQTRKSWSSQGAPTSCRRLVRLQSKYRRRGANAFRTQPRQADITATVRRTDQWSHQEKQTLLRDRLRAAPRAITVSQLTVPKAAMEPAIFRCIFRRD